MGSHDFYQSAHGASASEAYRKAVDMAIWHSGHDPYNGTISTTDGIRMVPPDVPIDEKEDWCLENTDKWGACGCWQDPDDPTLWHFAGWAAS